VTESVRSDESPIEIRPPAWWRIMFIVVSISLFVFGCWMLFGAAGGGAAFGVLFMFVWLTLLGVIVWRGLGLQMVAYPDEIVIANRFGTRHFARSSVQDFRVADHGAYRTIDVLLRDGTTISADASMRIGLGAAG